MENNAKNTHSDESSEYEVFKFSIPQWIRILRYSYPKHNTPGWEERLKHLEDLFEELKKTGFLGDIQPEDWDSLHQKVNYLEVQFQQNPAEHGNEPGEDLVDLAKTDPKLYINSGFDHPLHFLANRLESEMILRIDTFAARKSELLTNLRREVNQQRDIDAVHDALTKWEEALVYGDLVRDYKKVVKHLKVRYESLRREIELINLKSTPPTFESIPRENTLISNLPEDLTADPQKKEAVERLRRWFNDNEHAEVLAEFLYSCICKSKKIGEITPLLVHLVDAGYMKKIGPGTINSVAFLEALTGVFKVLGRKFTRQGFQKSYTSFGMGPCEKKVKRINEAKAEVVKLLHSYSKTIQGGGPRNATV